jgi:serine/threonine protein kinase
VPLQTGKVLNNRYRIVKLLGQGGFGAVYRAWDMNMECPRAVKENLDTSSEAQKQFKLEAKLLGDLIHPNLPRVIDHFIIPGQGQYLVMDYVDGEDLQEKLNRSGESLPESLVIPWIEQICDALTYLHRQNPPIIHRDIKPANIKITSEDRAMLVDFGIAKVYDPKLKTTIGARAVTPGYSPHEQYGQGKTDVRCDVYALGATLYTLLTNHEPVESIQRVVSDPLVIVEKLNPSVSPHIAAATNRAMRININSRFQSVSDFKEALNTGETIKTRVPNLKNVLLVMVIVAFVVWALTNILQLYLTPFVEINNHLARSVFIFINDQYQGRVDPYSSEKFNWDKFPMEVRYKVINPQISGRTIGDDLEFVFKDVKRYQMVEIDSIMGNGSERYFNPIVQNDTDKTCSIVINEFYPSENRPKAVARPYARVFFGYYKLLENSNVTLYCTDGTFYWWGERLGETNSEIPLYRKVRKTDGVLVFYLNE